MIDRFELVVALLADSAGRLMDFRASVAGRLGVG